MALSYSLLVHDLHLTANLWCQNEQVPKLGMMCVCLSASLCVCVYVGACAHLRMWAPSMPKDRSFSSSPGTTGSFQAQMHTKVPKLRMWFMCVRVPACTCLVVSSLGKRRAAGILSCPHILLWLVLCQPSLAHPSASTWPCSLVPATCLRQVGSAESAAPSQPCPVFCTHLAISTHLCQSNCRDRPIPPSPCLWPVSWAICEIKSSLLLEYQ